MIGVLMRAMIVGGSLKEAVTEEVKDAKGVVVSVKDKYAATGNIHFVRCSASDPKLTGVAVGAMDAPYADTQAILKLMTDKGEAVIADVDTDSRQWGGAKPGARVFAVELAFVAYASDYVWSKDGLSKKETAPQRSAAVPTLK